MAAFVEIFSALISHVSSKTSKRTEIRREATTKGCCTETLFFLEHNYLKSLTHKGFENPIDRRPLDYNPLPPHDQNGPALRIPHEDSFCLSRKSQ